MKCFLFSLVSPLDEDQMMHVLFWEPKCSPKSDTNYNLSALDEHKR